MIVGICTTLTLLKLYRICTLNLLVCVWLPALMVWWPSALLESRHLLLYDDYLSCWLIAVDYWSCLCMSVDYVCLDGFGDIFWINNSSSWNEKTWFSFGVIHTMIEAWDCNYALCWHIFVSVLITDDDHIDRMRWNRPTEAALPILQLMSASASPSHARILTR